jgi:cytochrome c
MKRVSVAVVIIGSLTASAAMAQDIVAGEASFKKCVICHAVGVNAKSKNGPVLNGLAGRAAGQIPGFVYSEANKKSGITWDEATFVDYIRDPKAKMPGTKMVFAGIKSADEAKNLWAFLAQFKADGSKN